MMEISPLLPPCSIKANLSLRPCCSKLGSQPHVKRKTRSFSSTLFCPLRVHMFNAISTTRSHLKMVKRESSACDYPIVSPLCPLGRGGVNPQLWGRGGGVRGQPLQKSSTCTPTPPSDLGKKMTTTETSSSCSFGWPATLLGFVS